MTDVAMKAGMEQGGESVAEVREKIFGAVDQTVANRWITQVRDREDDILTAGGWSVRLVKAELSNAMQTLERMGGRVGPGSKSGFWPEVFHLPEKVGEQVQQLRTGELEKRRAERNRVRIYPSGAEIASMERAIRWPGRYLPDVDLSALERDAEVAKKAVLSATVVHRNATSSVEMREAARILAAARKRHNRASVALARATELASLIAQCRPILHAWLRSEAENENWGDAVKGTGVPRSTADVRRRKGFRLIMEGLERDGVIPWSL